MKALAHSIEITARIELSKRELELLNNLLSYDLGNIARQVAPNSYNGGTSLEEMTDFLKGLRGVVTSAATKINEEYKDKRVILV